MLNSNFIGPVGGNELVCTQIKTHNLGYKYKLIPHKGNKTFLLNEQIYDLMHQMFKKFNKLIKR